MRLGSAMLALLWLAFGFRVVPPTIITPRSAALVNDRWRRVVIGRLIHHDRGGIRCVAEGNDVDVDTDRRARTRGRDKCKGAEHEANVSRSHD
jgi:hypothetical protein